MADMMEEGQEYLADQLEAHVSRSVTYQRGGMEVPVSAVLGRTLLRLNDGQGGTVIEWTDRDYLIQTADLILGGEETRPKRGDRIVDGDQNFEVTASGGEPHWRFSDPFQKLLRIHTKEIR